MRFTILGSKGFIGKELTAYLEKKGHDCFIPEMREENLARMDLNHVIFAIGVPNFMKRPFDAVDGHVCQLKKILQESNFESLVYFSGTRVYNRMNTTEEDQALLFNPLEHNDLYGISKVMGEALCIASKNPRVHIARLSNVTGNNFSSHLFLPSIIREAVQTKKIKIFTSLKSEKDYVYINDVCDLIYKIATNGKDRIYNVANGQNIKSGQLLEKIKSITDCQIEITPNAPEYSFSTISIKKIKTEFNFKPTNIIEKIDEIVKSFQKFYK